MVVLAEEDDPDGEDWAFEEVAHFDEAEVLVDGQEADLVSSFDALHHEVLVEDLLA